MKMRKKLLAIALTACMVISLLPATTFAASASVANATELAAALAGAADGNTITLSGNIVGDGTNPSFSLTVGSGYTITLDGQGHTITAADAAVGFSTALAISGGGTVILKDITLQGGAGPKSCGLDVEDGTDVFGNGNAVGGTALSESSGMNCINNSGGTVVLNSVTGGAVTGGYGYSYGLQSGFGTVIVTTATGGTTYETIGCSYGVYNENATVYVNTATGGTSTSGTNGASYGVYNNNTGTINVYLANGGSADSGGSGGVRNKSTGTVNATQASGTDYSVKCSAGTVNVGTTTGVINTSGGTTHTGADVTTLTLNKGDGASCVLDSITVAASGATTIGALPPVSKGGSYGAWYSDEALTSTFSATTVSGTTALYSTFYTPPIAPTITSANHTSVPARGGTFQVTATGTAPLTYSLTGAPIGVSIDAATGMITMNSLCSVNAGTDQSFTVTASNGTAPAATQNFTLTILDTPYIQMAGFTAGKVGEAYSAVTAALGSGTITWSISSGALPEGLTLSGSAISGIPTTAGNYTFALTATNANGSDALSYTITINAAPAVNNGGGSGGSGGGTPKTETPQVNTTTTGSGSGDLVTADISFTGTTSGGKQTVPIPSDTMTNLTDTVKKTETAGGTALAVINTGSGTGLSSVNVTIPGTQFAAFASGTETVLQIKSGLGTVAFSSDSVDAIGAAGSGDVSFGIGTVDHSALNTAQQTVVGNRPVYSFSVAVGGTKISEFGSNVTVTLPYTLTAGEDSNAIVVYYLDASGNLQAMQGKYDAPSGTVTFETAHFSEYVIGYNKITFLDVSNTEWYANAVTFLSAREITTGSGDGNFSPEAALTRGQFIVMLLRTYGIAADENPADNFTDAGNKYYTGYLAAAKRLDITGGVGNNRFAPEKEITRQEMFTLLYNALKVFDKLPSDASGKTLSDFADSGNVASWASEAMTALVKDGTVSGSGGKLSPTATTTRAEMAQVLYNLLKK